MSPERRSVTELNAYRALRASLGDLDRAQQTLADIERVSPDRERAGHLVTLRAIVAQLEALTRSLPER